MDEPRDRRASLEALECEFDRVLLRFSALGAGRLPEVESLLRIARRGVIRAQGPLRPSVAVVGASTRRDKFGNKAVRAFWKAGYDVYPINPGVDQVEGLTSYARLEDVPADHLDRVSVYVPAAVALEALNQAARIRVGEVWLNPGADAPEVVDHARSLGLNVILACSILAIGEHPSSFS